MCCASRRVLAISSFLDHNEFWLPMQCLYTTETTRQLFNSERSSLEFAQYPTLVYFLADNNKPKAIGIFMEFRFNCPVLDASHGLPKETVSYLLYLPTLVHNCYRQYFFQTGGLYAMMQLDKSSRKRPSQEYSKREKVDLISCKFGVIPVYIKRQHQCCDATPFWSGTICFH